MKQMYEKGHERSDGSKVYQTILATAQTKKGIPNLIEFPRSSAHFGITNPDNKQREQKLRSIKNLVTTYFSMRNNGISFPSYLFLAAMLIQCFQ